jgi:hypothetical protein
VSDRLDVAERLAEGRVAVEHTQTYVRACQTLGYEHPDLTSNPSQIRDWYGSEDGLDLRALDRDCTELRAAAAAVAEGLRMQRAQVAELAAAWTGTGGDSAVRFLERHCDAGNEVATEVRAAAQRCESLRDNLWFLLDSKVATAIAIDDRTEPQRPAWLAAAAAVTTGVGDRATAEEVVQQQIKPYVDNDIRNDWLPAMRSSLAGVAASYDMVTDRMAAAPAAYFESPGDLGTGCQPLQPAPPSAPPVAAAAAPAVAAVPPAVAPAAAVPQPTPALAPAQDLGAALGDAAAMPTGAGGPGGLGGLGDLGGGLNGLGGLGGLASRIVDAMSGLIGSAADQLTDPSALDDPSDTEDPFDEDASDDKDPFHPDDEHDDADDKPDSEAEKRDETKEAEEARPVDAPPPPVDGAPPPVDGPPPANTPAPVDAPPPARAPAPAAGPVANGSTPCEIAADQLPQAGQ